eukprot:c19311_g1_i1.p1 GENE.c19311_g1_i1~~c19311_g1_i1.p1  ORF type:complete len:256 (+),score=32.40 c19311_g1_i1:223-990(+)
MSESTTEPHTAPQHLHSETPAPRASSDLGKQNREKLLESLLREQPGSPSSIPRFRSAGPDARRGRAHSLPVEVKLKSVQTPTRRPQSPSSPLATIRSNQDGSAKENPKSPQLPKVIKFPTSATKAEIELLRSRIMRRKRHDRRPECCTALMSEAAAAEGLGEENVDEGPTNRGEFGTKSPESTLSSKSDCLDSLDLKLPYLELEGLGRGLGILESVAPTSPEQKGTTTQATLIPTPPRVQSSTLPKRVPTSFNNK